MSNVLVTGGAGFVGYHFSKKILDNNFSTIILDNLDDYYDIELKLKRLYRTKIKKIVSFRN